MSGARNEMHEWKLQEAGAKLDEVVRLAHEEGPQALTLDGERRAVVISAEAYASLSSGPTDPFVDFLLAGPPWDDEFVESILDRSRDTGRIVEF